MSKKNVKLLMSSLSLPQFNSIEDLSYLTSLSGSLLYCLSQKQELYYHTFSIPKRDGSMRRIDAPSYSMRIVQRWVLKNILEKVSPSKYAMAFRRGTNYGYKANASHHIETRYGVSFDLKNFFPSIDAKRVYNVFSNIGYSSLPATILTNLCTLNGVLPQGGACSPVLSNLVCLSLDSRLGGLCERRRIRFSRYADDMYFSSDSQDTLKKTVPIIRKIIESERFVINEKKIHYHTPSNHKRITGITIVREKDDGTKAELKASKAIKKIIRAEIFRAIYVGDYSEKDHILGEISYVNYIEPGYKDKIKQYIETTAQKIGIFPELVKLYNDNLFYKGMEPLILCRVDTFLQEHCDEEDDMLQEFYVVRDMREDYLNKHAEKNICKYSDWPPFSSELENDCELPF